MEPIVRSPYALYGAEGKFESIIYPGVGHEYTPGMWRRALEWMEREFQP